jgi:hypothetical protein
MGRVIARYNAEAIIEKMLERHRAKGVVSESKDSGPFNYIETYKGDTSSFEYFFKGDKLVLCVETEG